MQKVTKLWQDLFAGRIKSIDDFRQARAAQAVEADADPRSFERFIGNFTDGLRFDAPERLAAPSLLTAESTLRQHNRADWQHVNPLLMLWAARMIEAARRRSIPLYVHSAFRTRQEQNDLLARKVTRAAWPRAPHCLGEAVDIVHSAHHWQMSKAEWDFLGKLGKDVHARLMAKTPKAQRFELVWGGDFRSFYDPAHWEVADWRSRVRHLEPGDPRRLTPRGILALP